ncbi:MAG: GGDEF domain-containing protein [Sulfuritalea sp.]|jgi:diguanylate cyclase|nr:GGDEF domain-containing protein [Sulfuritalea sp.]
MKYHDSVAKSTEYLGPALSLMAKQTAAMDPVSYAVWYEYVAGINPALKIAIDEHLRNGEMLDETATYDIFNSHVAGIDEEVAQRFSDGLQKVMAEMSSSAAQAGDQAGQFGNALEKWCADQVSSNPGKHRDVETILGLTRNMQGSIASLKGHLDDSRLEVEQLRQEVGKARQDAIADGLTGLTNRRGFDAGIAACLSAADPGSGGPSLLMADIDHFKQVNDTYGHVFGDKVIRAVAQILKDHVKGGDMAARYGGEEFVVLLPDTSTEEARQLAEKIRTMVERVRIKRTADNWAMANISVSLGVASFRPGESATAFVARADVALYASKNAGRNRVTVAQA